MTARLLTSIGRLWTGSEFIGNAAILISDDRIAWIGPSAELPRSVPGVVDDIVDVDLVENLGGGLVTPRLIDAHTHPVYAGNRHAELAMRSTGLSDTEITAAGGGISSTITVTRGTHPWTPCKNPRHARAARVPVTFYAAQAVPPEFFGRRSDYIDAVCAWCADAAAVGADSVDVNCEDGRFTEEEARWILNAGRRAGLLPRLHACGNTKNGAVRVAAELGCASADLLHAATDEDVAALARGAVAAVISPGSALQQGARPPVRALLDKGVAVALGSDHTPGGVGITSMPLVIALAVSYLGMSVTEALRAATLRGAYALRAPDRRPPAAPGLARRRARHPLTRNVKARSKSATLNGPLLPLPRRHLPPQQA